MKYKDVFQRFERLVMPAAVLFVLAGLAGGCRNDSKDNPAAASLSKTGVSAASHTTSSATQQVNLVADVGGFGALRTDGNFQNAWGIAINPNGIVWIAANHTGLSFILDQQGNQLRPPVTIPTAGASTGGAPTGIVFNPTSQFVIPSTGAISKFIFAGEDGIISAWSSGSGAIVCADQSSANAVYKGLAMAQDQGKFFLYATNFKGNAVDVFDDHFQLVTGKPFNDAGIPAGFAPFGIRNVDGLLYVTYAKQKGPDNEDDEAGPGNGFVDIYQPNGMFVQRFASQGSLNSPWGIAEVPGDGNGQLEHAILIGDFGDGRINIFGKNGHFVGQLSDTTGSPVTIDGLWALTFAGSQMEDHGNDGNEHGGQGIPRLFFTAGPNEETDGLFGYFQVSKKVSKEGNGDDQASDSETEGNGGGHSGD